MAHDGFYGWLNNPAEVERVVASLPMPVFANAAPNLMNTWQGKTVLLYTHFRKVIGQDAPKGPQGIGDCVSWGWGNLCNYTQAFEILSGQPYEYQETATEAIYALSRVEVGGQRGSREDGSVGAWAAKAVSTYGVLSRTKLGAYDKNRAKDWGASGLPDDLEPEAKTHLIKTVSLISSFEEAAAAIVNGYPVAVCSNQGFSMKRNSDGFCNPEGQWAHCMCFVGVRDDKAGLCCSQSWGANTPSGPLALEQPDNTFWVDAETCNRMFRMKDSFTGSSFMGYPARDIINFHH